MKVLRDEEPNLISSVPLATKINPAVRAAYAQLERCRAISISEAEYSLSEQIGRLAEHKDVYAHHAAIWLVQGDKLVSVATHNYCEDSEDEIPLSDHGMIAMVARSNDGEHYYASNVCEAEHYRSISSATRSELVVPIQWDNKTLAILNFESRRIDGLEKAMPLIESRIPAMIPDLLVLQASLAKESFNVWNPSVCGWDLSKLLNQLLQSTIKRLSGSSPKITIWYPDWEKDQLYAYATYGYDWEFVDGGKMKLSDSAIGRSLSRQRDGLVELDRTEFIRATKVSEMGIDEAWVFPIVVSEKPIAAMTCYFTNPGKELDEVDLNDRALARQAIPELARIVAEIIEAYKVLRRNLACARIAALNRKFRDTPESIRFNEWLHSVIEVFDSKCCAGSAYNLSTPTTLSCVASTGFYDTDSGTLSLDLFRHSYDLNNPTKSHTKSAFRLAGKSVRRLCVGDTQELAIPDDCPIVANFRVNSEFLHGLNSGCNDRQLLACAYKHNGKTAGVIRLARSTNSRQFTRCDAELLEAICQRFAPHPIVRTEILEPVEVECFQI